MLQEGNSGADALSQGVNAAPVRAPEMLKKHWNKLQSRVPNAHTGRHAAQAKPEAGGQAGVAGQHFLNAGKDEGALRTVSARRTAGR